MKMTNSFKYKECMIGYNIGDWVDDDTRWATSFDIHVGPHPDRNGWAKDLRSTTSGNFFGRGDKGFYARALHVLLDFHHAVVRDNIDPMTAHSQFLKIEEYRAVMAEDVPVYNKLPDRMRYPHINDHPDREHYEFTKTLHEE
jgi:hypothetical protein